MRGTEPAPVRVRVRKGCWSKHRGKPGTLVRWTEPHDYARDDHGFRKPRAIPTWMGRVEIDGEGAFYYWPEELEPCPDM